MQQSNREPPGINFCSRPLRLVASFSFGKATSTPWIGNQCHQSLVLLELFSRSDAFVRCGQDLVSSTWSDKEMLTSSTLREIFAVKFVVLFLLDKLSGLTVKNALQTIKMFPRSFRLEAAKLTCLLKLCLSLTFVAVVEFRLRWSGFQELRTIRVICDCDDWGLSWNAFQNIALVWGPHSIDRFAN